MSIVNPARKVPGTEGQAVLMISHRQMSAAERALLVQRAQACAEAERHGLWALIGCPMILGLLGGLVAKIAGAIIGVLGGIAAGMRLVWEGEQRYRKARARYDQDLLQGQVEVINWTVRGAITLNWEECGCESNAFLLDLGEGQVGLLQGPSLDQWTDTARFPNRAIEIVQAPRSGVILQIVCKGEPLASLREDFVSYGQRRSLGAEEIQVFSGTLGSWASDLKERKGKVPGISVPGT